MTEPFLILHRVRGEPAFDIAIRTEIAGEEAWILASCGYRAYPYWYTHLIYVDAWDKVYCPIPNGIWLEKNMPPTARDCFACNDRPLREDTYTVQSNAKGMLERLGLVKKVQVERRD